MIEKLIAIYVFIYDILKKIDHKEPVSWNTSDSELITVALIHRPRVFKHTFSFKMTLL
jgi:hypothetical protein